MYLAAVQDARKRQRKQNKCVFGVATDSNDFEFVYLSPDRILYRSNIIRWIWNETTIVFYFIYSLSVFNLKIMTLYNKANKFSFLFLILLFRCLLELIWLVKSLQNQIDLTSSEHLNVRFFTRFPSRFRHRHRPEFISLWRFRCWLRIFPDFQDHFLFWIVLLEWYLAISCSWSNLIVRSSNDDNVTTANAQENNNCSMGWQNLDRFNSNDASF
jgi:hypothetical protein